MTLITDDMKTDWFPADIKPVHVGAYEVETINGTSNVYHCYFGQKGWAVCGRSPEEAMERANWDGHLQSRVWRGLKAPHNGETS